VRNSVILGAVDNVMPHEARVLYEGLRDTIANGDFPTVFGDLTPTNAREVAPADPALANSQAVKVARGSVVKITGSAPSCKRRIEGSGFVYSPQHVMTNAHVVAGTRGTVNVEVSGSTKAGRIVYYDPQLDLAVVYVAGLNAAPLDWAEGQAETGSDAVVVGYPLDGPKAVEIAASKDAHAELKLNKVRNVMPQLTNAEWLNSAHGSAKEKLFLNNCGSCHTLQRIFMSSHTAEEWKQVQAEVENDSGF